MNNIKKEKVKLKLFFLLFLLINGIRKKQIINKKRLRTRKK